MIRFLCMSQAMVRRSRNNCKSYKNKSRTMILQRYILIYEIRVVVFSIKILLVFLVCLFVQFSKYHKLTTIYV